MFPSSSFETASFSSMVMGSVGLILMLATSHSQMLTLAASVFFPRLLSSNLQARAKSDLGVHMFVSKSKDVQGRAKSDLGVHMFVSKRFRCAYVCQ